MAETVNRHFDRLLTEIDLCTWRAAGSPTQCLLPAVWHGVHVPDAWVGSVCDSHLPMLRAASTHVHQQGTACGLPGSVFEPRGNFCHLPDTPADAGGLAEALCLLSTGSSTGEDNPHD